jgi:hypothetical protein
MRTGDEIFRQSLLATEARILAEDDEHFVIALRLGKHMVRAMFDSAFKMGSDGDVRFGPGKVPLGGAHQ